MYSWWGFLLKRQCKSAIFGKHCQSTLLYHIWYPSSRCPYDLPLIWEDRRDYKIRQQMTLQWSQSECKVRYFTPHPNCSIFSSFKFQRHMSRTCHALLPVTIKLHSSAIDNGLKINHCKWQVLSRVVVFIFSSCDEFSEILLNLIAIKLCLRFTSSLRVVVMNYSRKFWNRLLIYRKYIRAENDTYRKIYEKFDQNEVKIKYDQYKQNKNFVTKCYILISYRVTVHDRRDSSVKPCRCFDAIN